MRAAHRVVNVNGSPFLSPRIVQRQQTALRAVTAARLLATGMARTVAEAAACTGSSRANVAAAVMIRRAEDHQLAEQVLEGRVSLLKAARQAKRVAAIVEAYRGASEQDLSKAAKIVGQVYAPPYAAVVE
jgi:hypothetical protein